MEIINENVDIPLSNFDILDLMNNKANIVLYPNLHQYKSIDELLGRYGVAFILFESQPKYGHWTLLFKLNNQCLEFFNPYGGIKKGFPDEPLNFIPKDFAKKSNQDIPYLSLLMIESPYKLSYNEFNLQEHNPNIKTCGRHCCVRLACRQLNLYQYKDFMKTLCKELEMNPDQLVTLFTI